MEHLKFLTITSILIFILMIPLAILNGVYGWIPDMILFIALILFYYWMYDVLRMNEPIFTLLVLGHLLHACGIFGWYNISPVGIQWDHITHFFGALPFALLIFRYREPAMDFKLLTKKNLAILLGVFLASTGVGAVVEITEFVGYLSLGLGDGALRFGPGDGVTGLAGSDLVDAIGGGWINEGWDFIFNTLGIFTGMTIMITIRQLTKKATKAYYFEPVEKYSKKI